MAKKLASNQATSLHTHQHHAEEGPHDHHHAEGHVAHHGTTVMHGSMKEYMTGFVLSVILTAIPFWLVMGDVLPSATATALTIMAFAAVQMVVHMVYFLHMDLKSENGWSFMALIFTLILVVITLVGSLWVMFHLNSNMMPKHTMEGMPANGAGSAPGLQPEASTLVAPLAQPGQPANQSDVPATQALETGNAAPQTTPQNIQLP